MRMLDEDGWYLERTRGSHRSTSIQQSRDWLHYLVNPETISLLELSTVF
jgi:hypothetical protein